MTQQFRFPFQNTNIIYFIWLLNFMTFNFNVLNANTMVARILHFYLKPNLSTTRFFGFFAVSIFEDDQKAKGVLAWGLESQPFRFWPPNHGYYKKSTWSGEAVWKWETCWRQGWVPHGGPSAHWQKLKLSMLIIVRYY